MAHVGPIVDRHRDVGHGYAERKPTRHEVSAALSELAGAVKVRRAA